MIKIDFFLGLFFLATCFMSCQQKTNNEEEQIPIIDTKTKIWAHRVNDTLSAQIKEGLFDGLEIDLFYSEFQSVLFLAHDIEDTLKNLSFETWLSSLKNPKDSNYWLDLKNLNINNAEKIATHILHVANNYGIKNNIIAESSAPRSLLILKNLGIDVLLWMDNIYWWDNKDTARWVESVTKKINILGTNSVSGDYLIYPLLSDSFPNLNIYYWNTPINNPTLNMERTIEMCRLPNVKVVLVDYDTPDVVNTAPVKAEQ
jgi:hypothetical protein